MSHCLRYQDPKICEHLASQYVLGRLTLRVQRRLTTLIQHNAPLNQAIVDWADRMAEMQYELSDPIRFSPPLTPQNIDDAWSMIEARTMSPKLSSRTPSKNRPSAFSVDWDSVLPWRVFAGFTSFASVLLLSIVLFSTSPTTPELRTASVITGPSYLANMAAHNQTTQETQFVIIAYAKTAKKPSHLRVQWSKKYSQNKRDGLHLWAEDKDTGQLVYVGQQKVSDTAQSWLLTKPTWTAVANSSRLLMTTDTNVPSENNLVFSGLCLQLDSWKA